MTTFHSVSAATYCRPFKTPGGREVMCYFLPAPGNESYAYVDGGDEYVGYFSKERAGDWMKFPFQLLDAIDRFHEKRRTTKPQ